MLSNGASEEFTAAAAITHGSEAAAPEIVGTAMLSDDGGGTQHWVQCDGCNRWY